MRLLSIQMPALCFGRLGVGQLELQPLLLLSQTPPSHVQWVDSARRATSRCPLDGRPRRFPHHGGYPHHRPHGQGAVHGDEMELPVFVVADGVDELRLGLYCEVVVCVGVGLALVDLVEVLETQLLGGGLVGD